LAEIADNRSFLRYLRHASSLRIEGQAITLGLGVSLTWSGPTVLSTLDLIDLILILLTCQTKSLGIDRD